MFDVSGTHYNASERIWSGPRKKDIFGSDITLGEAAIFMLSKNPEKVMQIMDTTGEELTAAQLLVESKLMLKSYQRLGMQLGDVVGISASNTPHLAAVILGAFMGGLPTNALFPGFDKESVEIIFKVTMPKIIFCDVENYATIKEAMEEIKTLAEIFLMNGQIEGVRHVEELLLAADDEDLEHMSLPCSKLTGDDTAVILCSSGTTGTPKGVCCSHKALLNQQVYTNLRHDSVIFAFSTMYWASGLWTFTSSLLNVVKRVITDKPFTPEYFLHLIEKHHITDLISGPPHIAEVLQIADAHTRQRLSSIRSILCGGSKVPKIVAQKMNEILGIEKRAGFSVAYGMSELSSMLSANIGGPEKRREGTEGKLLPNKEVRIVGKHDKLLAVNEAGIIHIRTPYKWQGYYRNAEATSKSYLDGWLVTGDIGFFDDAGFLNVCARDNDVFKSNNFQIYPQQIEDVIMQLPGVLEVCVFGVPDFVACYLTACAVVRADNERGDELRADDIVTHVASNMAGIYHIKAGVYFVEALPKTGSGKIQRRRVWNMLQGVDE